MKNNVNSFTFYRDYFELIDTIPIKDKKDILCSIVDYVFKEIEPNLEGHNKAIFNTLSHQLDNSKNQSKRRTGTKPKENQKETETLTEEKPNKNKTSILSFIFYISNFKFIYNNELLKNKVLEWLEYKKQKRKPYTEIGLNTLLKKIEENSKTYGIENVVSLIDDCIANNYQGIIWEKLENKKAQKSTAEEIAKKNKEARERVLGVFDEQKTN